MITQVNQPISASASAETHNPKSKGIGVGFVASFRRDWLVAIRHGADLVNPLVFFLIAITLIPLGVGPERELLAAQRAVFLDPHDPAVIARDRELKAGLGVEAMSFNASLLFEPHTVRNKAGGPFQVLTRSRRIHSATPS